MLKIWRDHSLSISLAVIHIFFQFIVFQLDDPKFEMMMQGYADGAIGALWLVLLKKWFFEKHSEGDPEA